MRNNFIDENIFKIDDINLLIGSEGLFNSPCVVIQNVDYTPLQASLIHNSIKIRDFILKQNSVDINAQNSKGENALVTAIVNKAPLTFIKELFRRNIEICLPNNSKYSSIIDFADPQWEGYSELKHMVQRRKSYNFNYKKQNSERQIENKCNHIEKKETELSNYSIDVTQFGSELAESHEKNHGSDNSILNFSKLNGMNFDHASLNSVTNYLGTDEVKYTSEPSNQIANKKNTIRSISKSIFIPKNVVKPNIQSSTKKSKKDTSQAENSIQEITSINYESEISLGALGAEKKGEEYQGSLVSMQNIILNDEEHGTINNRFEVRTDKNNSSKLISEKICKFKPSEKNTKHERITEKMTKNQDCSSDQKDEDYNKYIGVDDEYMLLIGQQLNESMEASKKLFTCTCCAGARPWKSEAQ
ncbi:uncharacterized protein ELE39_001569 [Cryptosporidium sp. chipmunk genotype I]|uniref:uncharacterized protein n=1 Tax=Cryptosporidium sp. chipmunk genotype I TaxID=1280935 RepID=UPI00351A2489|nr:hypothetical protein ELE39_001569 [Cryptosporidium sp. chipmunk genotype I]